MILDIQCCSSLLYKTKTHAYFLPHPSLQSVIAHYTLMNDASFTQESLILVPDLAGCIIIQQIDQELQCIFWGATTTSTEVKPKPQQIAFRFFIEFLPVGAYTLFHQSQSAFLNETIPLHILQKELQETIQLLYEESSSLSQFIKGIDEVLSHLMLADTTCVRFVQTQLHHTASIEEVMDQVGYSRRHLQRMFQEQVGCSMKDTQRITRINHSIQLLHNQAYTIAQVAHACGYFDQSHFIHDFKQIIGSTPKDYQRNQTDYYNETMKF